MSPLELYRSMINDAGVFLNMPEADIRGKSGRGKLPAVRAAAMVCLMQYCDLKPLSAGAYVNRSRCLAHGYMKRHADNLIHWREYREIYERFANIATRQKSCAVVLDHITMPIDLANQFFRVAELAAQGKASEQELIFLETEAAKVCDMLGIKEQPYVLYRTMG